MCIHSDLEYWKMKGTWRVAPIILDARTLRNIPQHSEVVPPYQLVEGHTRLGYLLALELANDQYHQEALTHWQQAKESLPLLVTTSYVVNEVVTYFNSRGHHTKAVEIGNMLLHSPSVRLIHVDEALFYEGWAYFQQYKTRTIP